MPCPARIERRAVWIFRPVHYSRCRRFRFSEALQPLLKSCRDIYNQSWYWKKDLIQSIANLLGQISGGEEVLSLQSGILEKSEVMASHSILGHYPTSRGSPIVALSLLFDLELQVLQEWNLHSKLPLDTWTS